MLQPIGELPNILSDGVLSIVPLGDPGAVFCLPTFCFGVVRPNLVLDGGNSLESPFTHVAPGYIGPSSDGGESFLSQAGEYSIDPAHNSQILLQAPELISFSFDITHELNDKVDIFFNAYADRTQNKSVLDGITNLSILAASPYNPFQQNITVRFGTGVPSISKSISENTRLRIGGIFHFSESWSGLLEAGWAKNTSTIRSDRPGAALPTAQTFLESIALSDPTASNWGDLSPYFFTTSYEYGPLKTDLVDASFRFSGPLFNLPAGQVTLTGLLEGRREIKKESYQFVDPAPDPSGYTWFPKATSDVRSAYLEVRVPIFGEGNSIPLVSELNMVGAVRWDSYDIEAPASGAKAALKSGPFDDPVRGRLKLDSTDYTLGIQYRPIQDLMFRASYATGFVPPSLTQITTISSVTTASFSTLRDPLRGNEFLTGDPLTGLLTELSGGSNTLQPEESESLSFGVVLEPLIISGFRASVDFTSIKKSDEITSLSTQFIIDQESEFPGRVVRGPNLPGDPVGYAGPIVLLDRTYLNALRTKAEAIDFRLSYERSTDSFGDWTFNAVATHQLSLERRNYEEQSKFDLVSFTDGPLAWRAIFGVTWAKANWTLGWNTQYFHSYLVGFGSPGADVLNGQRIIDQGDAKIPSQNYSDFFVRYSLDAGDGLLSNADFMIGVQNVFDKTPPILSSSVGGLYSQYGDPRLRRFTLSLRKHF